jgi:hypothetical protein
MQRFPITVQNPWPLRTRQNLHIRLQSRVVLRVVLLHEGVDPRAIPGHLHAPQKVHRVEIGHVKELFIYWAMREVRRLQGKPSLTIILLHGGASTKIN